MWICLTITPWLMGITVRSRLGSLIEITVRLVVVVVVSCTCHRLIIVIRHRQACFMLNPSS